MPALRPLTSSRYGHLEIIRRDGREVVCRCDCGRECRRRASSVRRGITTSCGCRSSEKRSAEITTHGLSQSPEYRVWIDLRRRCANPQDSHWPDYGGRGIHVCDAWAESFESFLADAGPRPSPKHSLDRIDNDGNYEPGNVRWATPVEQGRNKRNNRRIEWRGENLTISEWAARTGLSRTGIADRIAAGWGVERALTEVADARRWRRAQR